MLLRNFLVLLLTISTLSSSNLSSSHLSSIGKIAFGKIIVESPEENKRIKLDIPKEELEGFKKPLIFITPESTFLPFKRAGVISGSFTDNVYPSQIPVEVSVEKINKKKVFIKLKSHQPLNNSVPITLHYILVESPKNKRQAMRLVDDNNQELFYGVDNTRHFFNVSYQLYKNKDKILNFDKTGSFLFNGVHIKVGALRVETGEAQDVFFKQEDLSAPLGQAHKFGCTTGSFQDPLLNAASLRENFATVCSSASTNSIFPTIPNDQCFAPSGQLEPLTQSTRAYESGDLVAQNIHEVNVHQPFENEQDCKNAFNCDVGCLLKNFDDEAVCGSKNVLCDNWVDYECGHKHCLRIRCIWFICWPEFYQCGHHICKENRPYICDVDTTCSRYVHKECPHESRCESFFLEPCPYSYPLANCTKTNVNDFLADPFDKNNPNDNHEIIIGGSSSGQFSLVSKFANERVIGTLVQTTGLFGQVIFKDPSKNASRISGNISFISAKSAGTQSTTLRIVAPEVTFLDKRTVQRDKFIGDFIAQIDIRQNGGPWQRFETLNQDLVDDLDFKVQNCTPIPPSTSSNNLLSFSPFKIVKGKLISTLTSQNNHPAKCEWTLDNLDPAFPSNLLGEGPQRGLLYFGVEGGDQALIFDVTG